MKVAFPFTASTLQPLEHWMLIDATRVPGASQQAYQHEEQPELRKLFQGSNFEYLNDQSPVLFSLVAHSTLIKHWCQSPLWRSSAVVFSLSAGVGIDLLTQHLQNLMRVNIQGKVMLFRCYNNAIWMDVADQLSEADINTLLGPAEGLSWVDDAQTIQSLYREPALNVLPASPYNLQSNVWNKWI